MAQQTRQTNPDTIWYLRTHQTPAQWLGPFHSEDGMLKAKRAWLERIKFSHYSRDVECYASPKVYRSKVELEEVS